MLLVKLVETYIRLVLPVLVASGAVTRVEDDFLAGIVQTSFVSPDLSRLTQHPVLQYKLTFTHLSPMTRPVYFG